jgi:3-hydroxy-D-aspartate aldolase
MGATLPPDIGTPLADVETPALILDLDAFDRNLAHMARTAAEGNVRLRPHAKSHKCAAIALRQMALGAVGVCCQKVSEAEALIDRGVTDVLVSNEVIDPPKLRRLAALAERATVALCVDNAAVVPLLQSPLDVLVEIDVGGNRCGIDPGEPALRLAERIANAPNLRFRGLHAYHGSAQHIRSPAERADAASRAASAAQRTADLLRTHGIACDLITGGGSGTYQFDITSGVYTEIQPGSYIFMDADYARNESPPPFEHSLFVYTQVMSTPGRGYAVVDAGLKALAVDSGMPTVDGCPTTVLYSRPSDEHGVLTPGRFALGDKLRLIPGHCDPTVNLYDYYVAVRDGRVEAIWPVDARGALT